MLIYTPVDLPKIEPDNWDIFWDIWNEHKDYLEKTKHNAKTSLVSLGKNTVWTGLDIFKRKNIETAWQAPYYDIKDVLPNMYNFFESLDTFGIFRIRLVQSNVNIISHTDDNIDKWHLRAYFHYTSKNQQWYFTKPNDSNGERKYINLPNETNWFMYNDKFCWHGTDFDVNNKKILLQVYATKTPHELLSNSVKKYLEYTIGFDDDTRI